MKMCPVCGRRNPIGGEGVYCSQRCRGNKAILKNGDEEKILDLLRARPRASTICPSEILPSELKTDKSRMEIVRMAARRLVNKGLIQILQKSQVVDPSDFCGPIRLRLKP